MAEVAEKSTEEITKSVEGAKAEAEAEEAVAPAEEKATKDAAENEKAKEADVDADKNGDGDGDGDADGGDDTTCKLERKIIRQVEYYFSDANLRRDKFLLEQISKDDDGWVPFSVLLTFKRLASLSTDVKEIVEALMKSDEGLLEISEDRLKLRRHPERPIPEHNEEVRKEIMSRTAYAKGFPLETDMAELIDYFAPYEKVIHINMRKYLDKPTKEYKFKGSIFVTFEKKEQAQEFIEKDKVVYKERELLRKWQEKYLEDKKEELKSKSKKNKSKAAVEEDKIELPKGTILFFEGANDDVTRESIREAFERVKGDWEIAYVDFCKGDKVGHIRLQEEDKAKKFLENLKDQKLKIKDDLELTMRVLTEEEEKTYLEKAIGQMKNRRNQNKHKGNRKRRGGNDNSRRDEKKTKTEDE